MRTQIHSPGLKASKPETFNPAEGEVLVIVLRIVGALQLCKSTANSFWYPHYFLTKGRR